MARMVAGPFSFPKAELHLHLEGSIEPHTLRELAPGLPEPEIEARYQHASFQNFLKNYVWVVGHLKEPDDFALIASRLLEGLAQQNVVYAEINLSVGVMLWRKQDVGAIFNAILTAAGKSPVRTRWIFDAVRQFGAAHAREVAEFAARSQNLGVVAFGLGGDESLGPPEWFGEVCSFSRSEGLKLAIHAGETAGPGSIWGALNLGAHRIGHGIRAVEDPALIRRLAEAQVPLEISITSNVATGLVGRLEEHPVRRLFEAGAPLTLNTDDPGLFRTTLTREYELAASHFGFTESELREVAANSFRYAFGWDGGDRPS
jgi:aminodeoxyfutalosine deaminase